MITYIEIENFRSIYKQNIVLEPLTILIGANGSGKSNFVKAIEFISEIPRSGIEIAASKHGGAEGVVPKCVQRKDIGKTKTYIKYGTRLVSPLKETENAHPIDVDHELHLSFTSRQHEVRVDSEVLVFHQVLYLSEIIASEDDKAPVLNIKDIAHPDNKSQFRIEKLDGKKPSYSCDPPITENSIIKYLDWLGLKSFEGKVNGEEELSKLLEGLWEHSKKGSRRTKKNNPKKYSFLDPNVSTILDFSSEFRFFLSTVAEMRRFDLLLHELRQEQQVGDSDELATSGNNIPSVLRSIANNNSKKNSWDKIIETYSTVAPHVLKMKPSSLRSGKEFVEFIEAQGGRTVESWQSSDGSLRALAILLAIETATPGTTIIIEEPEQNLHPWAISTLMDHMRDVVERRRVQIIVTTHSEQVLNRVNVEEVRVVSRSEDKGTELKLLSEITNTENIDMGDIGRLWVKGLLGGVPV